MNVTIGFQIKSPKIFRRFATNEYAEERGIRGKAGRRWEERGRGLQERSCGGAARSLNMALQQFLSGAYLQCTTSRYTIKRA